MSKVQSVRPIRSVSVLMPTWQGMEFLERVLAALAAQRIALPWDFLAIDSGSTDGTWELLGRFQERFPVPFRRERIDQVEFDHGDTRNLLAATSTGDLCVFLTQDAIPSSPDWLATLAANFDDPKVGAAYCRNVPRPDAQLLTKIFSANDPGYTAGRRETRLPEPSAYALMNAHEKRLLYNFNDVASAVRRELWERHPFPRTWFGEDVLLARALLEAGWTVVYDDVATVEHSHDYGPEETFARAKIDARFNAEWLDRVCVATKQDARVLTERLLEEDRDALRKAGLSDVEYGRELEKAARLRAAAFEGLHEGSLAKARHPATRVLDRTDLDVLYVVHGFPPDTWAGTEIYTYNLAQELARRGHRVTILARAPATKLAPATADATEERLVAGRLGADGTPEDFSLTERTFQGLRLLRMTHRLEHRSIRDSYEQPRAEAVFRALLARERFDLVHFQHLIHLSAGLVRVAKEAGLATLLTCHDYWSLCARVQLIRPDGVRCEENMGAGCFLCVKEKHYERIPRAKRMDGLAAPLLDALAKGARKGRALPEKVRRRWEGFADLRARHAFVTQAYQLADLRVTPSRFLRRKLIDTAGFDAHSLVFSDNGMRTDHVRALEKRPDGEGRVRFGFVGSLVWYKGGEVLVEAMRRLAGERAVLHVHGAFEPEKDPHHARLKELAGPNVVFHGRFDNARLSEVYAELDVLVVPSTWFENSPITIHEAYLTKTPVVASDIGGMKEYVRDGVDGLTFRTGDAADLAAKLLRFVREPGLVAALARDWMRVKTIAEDAAVTEFRYKGLVARRRGKTASRIPAVLWERRGNESAARSGPVEVQGADYLLVRPGGVVEYDVSGAGGGRRRLRIEQFALGAERSVRLEGRVSVDGSAAGELAPFAAEGRDATIARELELDLPAGTTRLALEPAPGAYLRLARLVLLSVPDEVLA
ncbi:MAG: glycosyltransferase [Planctomycetes bacterium]|nr:glycosyltransferase [Planctomycetota bacterium]